jgi:hypothetical protein
MPKLWKVFKENLKSNNGDIEWKIGEWQKHNGKLEMCCSGFHASKRIIDAMGYTNAEEIALVEVRGDSLKQDDKQCWSEMRLLKVYKWTKKDSVSLAIYAAELVLGNYEKKYPDDKRPREAIEAAKNVLKNDNRKNREAAEAAAEAARSAARSAWSAARSAARSAWSAAWSAEAAAEAARSAARSAWSAAWSAEAVVYQKTMNKCEVFIKDRMKGE